MTDTTSSSALLDETEGIRLRRKLAFFLLNPYDKWLSSGQWPWKLIVQMVKILVVTVQLVTFAASRQEHLTFVEESNTVLRHVMLGNWTDARDVASWPPGAGPYGVYTNGGLRDALSMVILKYYYLNTTLFNKFDFAPPDDLSTVSSEGFPPLQLKLSRHVLGEEHPAEGRFKYDMRVIKEKALLSLDLSERTALTDSPCSVIDLIERKTNLTIEASTMLTLEVGFEMRTMRGNGITPRHQPNCMQVDVWVTFDNTEKSGFVKIGLENTIEYVQPCHGVSHHYNTYMIAYVYTLVIDIFVAFLCCVSFVLCTRNLLRARRLGKRTEMYFLKEEGVRLTWSEKSIFVNGWYVGIVCNDVLIIIGTLCKAAIEFNSFTSSLFTMAGMCLGLGTLLVYCGLLRYFGFFNRYNILILTLKRSLPNCGRFLVCTSIIYTGFMLCGWVLLGPYSLKFASIWSTFATMFALINGDDMFATFYTISPKMPWPVLAFARTYLVLFISLFIYVVLSLFISIIMDAYEVVKDRHTAMEACNNVSRIESFVEHAAKTQYTNSSRRAGELTEEH